MPKGTNNGPEDCMFSTLTLCSESPLKVPLDHYSIGLMDKWPNRSTLSYSIANVTACYPIGPSRYSDALEYPALWSVLSNTFICYGA